MVVHDVVVHDVLLWCSFDVLLWFVLLLLVHVLLLPVLVPFVLLLGGAALVFGCDGFCFSVCCSGAFCFYGGVVVQP